MLGLWNREGCVFAQLVGLLSAGILVMLGDVVAPVHTAYAQPAAPTPSRAVEAKQKQDAAWRQAREAYRQAIIAADEQYVSDLDAALKNAMQALNIDLARTFDDLKKSALAVLQRDQAELDVAGEWRVAAAHVKTTVVTNGLVGYWPLDGKTINWATGVVQDISSHGNNGRLIKMSATASPVPGKNDQALHLNGIAYVDIPMAVSFADLSVSVWFKSNIIGNSNPRIIANSHTDVDNRGFQIAVAPAVAGAPPSAGVFNIGNGATHFDAAWAQRLSVGQWYHYVGVYNGSTIVSYLNGVQVSAASAVGGPVAPSGLDVTIGRNPAYNGDYFDGAVDDVRIYNRPLSTEEVKQLFSAGH